MADPIGVLMYVGAMLAIVLALIVFRAAPGRESAHAYLVSALSLACLCFTLAEDPEWSTLLTATWIYWPVSFWWLASTFGRKPLPGAANRYAWSLTSAAGLGILLIFLGPAYAVHMADLSTSAWGRWASLMGVGFWLAALVNFLLTMRGSVGRPQLKRAIALATFACLPPLWPETVSASTGLLSLLLLRPVAGIGLAAYLSLAIWFVKHRNTESELQFERPVSYVAFAVFLLGLYFVLIGGVGKAVEWMGGDLKAFLSALGGVLIAVLGLALASSGRVWARMRDYVDRNFYRGEVDFRSEWIRISEELSALPDPRNLGATLSGLLAERLKTSTVFLYRLDADGQFGLWSRRGGSENPPEHLGTDSQWTDWLWRLGSPAEWSAVHATDVPKSLHTQTRLVVPLIAKQEVVALACIGGRSDDFTAEEMLWLEAAGQQAAIGVLAANLTESLIESRELASFHRLSSFVVHDVKNAVSMLSLLLQNLEQGKGEVTAAATQQTVRLAAAKLTGLIDRFASARESFKLKRQPLDLTTLVAELNGRLAPGFPGVSVSIDLAPGLQVNGDSEQLTRVFENMFINACEAMQGKGELKISGQAEDVGTAVTFVDSGPGMDDDFIRERLFRPFATTKKKGLGIGLYQSREIVRAHGGRMTARSEPGQGATFTVWLPDS